MYLNHKRNEATPLKIVAITKITRRNTMQKNKRNILGKPFSTREKNPTILCYIIKRISSNDETLMHTRGCSTTLKLAPKRGAHFSPRRCTC
jgi:hypothetical protein